VDGRAQAEAAFAGALPDEEDDAELEPDDVDGLEELEEVEELGEPAEPEPADPGSLRFARLSVR
jgi:hypothetical protein